MDRDHAEFQRKGLDPSEIIRNMERPVPLSDGRHTKAVYSAVGITASAAPSYYEFVSQQHVPQAVWVPEWQLQENDVIDLADVTVFADDLDSFHTRFQALFGADKLQQPGSPDVVVGSSLDIRSTHRPQSQGRATEQRCFPEPHGP